VYENVSWLSKYNIGIVSIDEQHQELFELSNKFFALNEDDSKEEFKKLIYEFNKYMAVHFKDEEEHMQEIGYPELEAHKILHKNIILRITTVLKESGSIPTMKAKMKEVARNFFIDHILKHDIKIKYFCDHHKLDDSLEDITDQAFK